MTTNMEQEKTTKMTTVSDALVSLEKYATDEITQIARDYIEETLAQFGCSDESIVREVVEDDSIQAGISFHVEKVMERGWNEGRIQARGRFLTQDWELEGREDFMRAIGDALTRRGCVLSVENAKKFLEQTQCSSPAIIHDALRGCDDVMSPELCAELDMPDSSTFAEYVAESASLCDDNASPKS